jgi:acetyl-CoA C-acetyltransferase
LESRTVEVKKGASMDRIRDKVAVIGMGCTKFGEYFDRSVEDLIIDATYEALADANVEAKDIQAAWAGTVYSGQAGMSLARPLKLPFIPVTRIENACGSGMDAFRNACFAVAAGAFDLALVCGFEKAKDFYPGSDVGPFQAQFALGMSAPGQYAMLATRYFAKYEIGKETLAKIAVKNHHNGSLSPKAHLRREVTIDQVMNAPIIAWPLGLFDCCARSEGSAAAVITRAEMAKNFTEAYILVKGFGLAAGTCTGRIRSDYDFVHFDENVNAAKQAYTQAGITKPDREIDIAQLHDCFTITELVTYEDLGFCPRGGAKDYIDADYFALGGELPVNTDGGLKCFGHPAGASGLRMIYEVYNQILGRADQRQLKNVETGLAHNLGGVPGEGANGFVTILGR